MESVVSSLWLDKSLEVKTENTNAALTEVEHV